MQKIEKEIMADAIAEYIKAERKIIKLKRALVILSAATATMGGALLWIINS